MTGLGWLIIGICVAAWVVQTLRVWMAESRFEKELKAHCESKIAHEKKVKHIAIALQKHNLHLSINGHMMHESFEDDEMIEWPEDFIS